MMSGCGILTNGKGTRREYGEYNLDELSVSDIHALYICFILPTNIQQGASYCLMDLFA